MLTHIDRDLAIPVMLAIMRARHDIKVGELVVKNVLWKMSMYLPDSIPRFIASEGIHARVKVFQAYVPSEPLVKILGRCGKCPYCENGELRLHGALESLKVQEMCISCSKFIKGAIVDRFMLPLLRSPLLMHTGWNQVRNHCG